MSTLEKLRYLLSGTQATSSVINCTKNLAKNKRVFLQGNGLPEDESYIRFISPSSLSVEQINEIMIAVNTIGLIDDKAHFIVKLHPKTTTQSVKAVRKL